MSDDDSLVLTGQTLSFVGDPFAEDHADDPAAAAVHIADGAVWIEAGHIRSVGNRADVCAAAGNAPVIGYGDCLITAGFIDCHAHYPQLPIIASYGEQLLTWLETYTFPVETRFSDPDFARTAADFFLEQSLANGVTTSAVYATVHETSVDAYFEAASVRNLRTACGKVLMDRNAPPELRDSARSGYDVSKSLIDRWHDKGRNVYAITPRFAPTSSPEQLDAAGTLWREYPDTLMQTHLSENSDEIAWVANLFPDAPDYLGVYDIYGLTGPGAIFGHAIHLNARERALLAETGSAVAHCPTSNLFIGSGLFDISGMRSSAAPVTVGLASDVAGGTSLSPFRSMRAAYEIAQLRGHSLHPAKLWHLATVGGATAMRMADKVGNLASGMEADICVIDLKSTPMIASRVRSCETIWEALFAQMILADERAIRATFAAGTMVYEAPIS